ncbi:MAG: hypothetical protein HKL80_10625 [Acidimicrobiales bacterium]|nr:hypothetical protein [Acidimicrobiales bacterium]
MSLDPIESKLIVKKLSESKSELSFSFENQAVYEKELINGPAILETPLEVIAVPGASQVLSRLKSASGLKHTLKTAVRRLAVATLAVLSGWLDDERVLTRSLVESQKLMAERIDELQQQITVMNRSHSDLLKVASDLELYMQSKRESGTTPKKKQNTST